MDLAQKLWGSLQPPAETIGIKFGKGSVYWGGGLHQLPENELYPSYKNTLTVLSGLKVAEDFKSGNNTIRFGIGKPTIRIFIMWPTVRMIFKKRCALSGLLASRNLDGHYR